MYKRNLVFASACLGMLLFGMMLITLGSILPSLAQKFNADEIRTATLASILPFGILLGSLVFGPVVDRYGYKNLLIICTLLLALALQGLAFSKTFLMIQVCIFITGFGGGVINGGANALVADISSEGKGANLSLLGVFFGFGALGMPLLLGLLSGYFHYPVILSAVGICLLVAVLFFLYVRFPVPKQTQGMPIKEGVKLLKEPALLLTGFFLFFQSGMEGLINNWTTTFLQSELKVSEKNALFALTLFVTALTIARLLLSAVLKKISSFPIMLISLSLSFAGGFLLMYSTSYNMAVANLVLLGAGLAAGFPVVVGYIGDLYASLSGTAFSIALVIALAGNMLLNYLMGIIFHYHSMGYLPVMLLSCAGCLFVLIFLIRKNISLKMKM